MSLMSEETSDVSKGEVSINKLPEEVLEKIFSFTSQYRLVLILIYILKTQVCLVN